MTRSVNRVPVEELTFRVSMAAISAFIALFAVLFTLNGLLLSAVISGTVLFVLLVGLITTIITSLSYKLLMGYASEFWNFASDVTIDEIHNENYWGLLAVLFSLGLIGGALYYSLASSQLGIDGAPTGNIFVIINSSEANGWDQIRGIFVELLMSSSLVASVSGFVGIGYGIFRSIFPLHVCPECGEKIKPDFKWCPYCRNELDDMYTMTGRLRKILHLGGVPANSGNSETDISSDIDDAGSEENSDRAIN